MNNEKDKAKSGDCNMVHAAGDTSCKKHHAAAPAGAKEQTAARPKSSEFVTDPGHHPMAEQKAGSGKDGVATRPGK